MNRRFYVDPRVSDSLGMKGSLKNVKVGGGVIFRARRGWARNGGPCTAQQVVQIVQQVQHYLGATEGSQ